MPTVGAPIPPTQTTRASSGTSSGDSTVTGPHFRIACRARNCPMYGLPATARAKYSGAGSDMCEVLFSNLPHKPPIRLPSRQPSRYSSVSSLPKRSLFMSASYVNWPHFKGTRLSVTSAIEVQYSI